MSVRSKLKFGIDLGIASCGWAVIEWDDATEGSDGTILALGTRTFDAPETDKERTPTNQLRRQHRGLRRVLRRRQQRMSALRALFAEAGLLADSQRNALKVPGLDPWELRAKGLDHKLAGQELAIALGHIARHRGFKSNSKRDRSANAADDSSKMLSAIGATQTKLAQYRTVGEMFARDPDFAGTGDKPGRKRNRDGDYSRSVLRDDQAREVRVLFTQQRKKGNTLATEDLEDKFAEIAFFQRPLQDSEDMVGFCPFEPQERRAAKYAYSFERFRFLSRLAVLRIEPGERALTPDEIARIDGIFGQGKTGGVTYKALRNLLDLADSEKFSGVSAEDEKNDFVARTGKAAEGTASLRTVIVEALGELAWMALLKTPEKLDNIARVLTFRDDLASIRTGLEELELDQAVLDVLFQAVEGGKAFSRFKGAGHISAKACRAILPHLQTGLMYSDACAKAGYNHAERMEGRLEGINNPIAQKAIREALKQVKTLIHEFDHPDAIHVELARDVGKSKEERDEIKSGIDKRTKAKERLRQEFSDTVGHAPNGEDLLRFELWKEQNGRSLYSDQPIPVHLISASDNNVQVDHILPWSRFGDDSFINKTLCFASENQEKRGSTPYEWFDRTKKDWASFQARVETIKWMKGRKKRNYVLKDADERAEKFKARNLNDTRYACRVLMDELKRAHFPQDGKKGENRHVLARPGALTDKLRRAWGLHEKKKDTDGSRLADDRHHALDALIVAVMTESELDKLTLAFQKNENLGLKQDFAHIDPPWPDFREQALEKHREIFVSRAERRRARGEGHAATIRQIVRHEEGETIYERKSIDGLSAKDLDRIKDPERNEAIVAALRTWIAAGKPLEAAYLPRSHTGDVIRKVRLSTNKKVDVEVRDGAADRGEMARVDIFRKKGRREVWEYYAVPVYPHQVFDQQEWPAPPDRAVLAGKPEKEWPLINTEYEFMWSLYPMSFVEITKPDGTFIDGYFRGLDRSTASITLSPHHTKAMLIRGIGIKTLKDFKKITVDRLGRRFEIEREKRTWHGEVCM